MFLKQKHMVYLDHMSIYRWLLSLNMVYKTVLYSASIPKCGPSERTVRTKEGKEAEERTQTFGNKKKLARNEVVSKVQV